MTATKGLITGAATTALDTRKANAALLAASAAGVPRLGVLGSNPSIVTADASTTPMRLAVASAGFATSRGVSDGVVIWTNDGSVFVTVTKPGANSHYVVVYAKHNDASQGDPNNLPEIGVVTGSAAASPTVPAIPTGALELARVLIPSTATATTSAGVVITNTYPMTGPAGSTILLRDQAEKNAWSPPPGSRAYRLDAKCEVQLINGIVPNWYHSGGRPFGIPITFGGGYSSSGTSPARLHDQLGRFHLEGKVVTASTTFTGGVNTPIATIPATYAPDTDQEYVVVANGIFCTLRVTSAGAISFIPSQTFTSALSLTLAPANWRNKNL